jgi:hypothetical protein
MSDPIEAVVYLGLVCLGPTRAITLIGIPSAQCNRRLSTQSSTDNTYCPWMRRRSVRLSTRKRTLRRCRAGAYRDQIATGGNPRGAEAPLLHRIRGGAACRNRTDDLLITSRTDSV